MANNTRSRWPLSIIVIHWLTALCVVGLFAVGVWMVELTYYSEWYRVAPHWHKSIGLLLAAVTLLRIGLRAIKSRPPAYGTKMIIALSHVGHLAIYVLLLVMFVSGYLISTADGRGIDVFNWFTLPSIGEFFPRQEDIAGEIHEYAAWSLIALAVLHSLAAIKHHILDKDNTLVQMIKPR